MRNINESDLPSKGLFGNRQIVITPVKYGIISKYKNMPSKSTAQRLLKDLNTYIKDIPGWEKLCSFDYAALVFLKKGYTVSNGEPQSTMTVKCSSCGSIINIKMDLANELEFPDISDLLLNIKYIDIGGIRLKKYIPNMEEFELILQKLVSFDEQLDEPEIMIRAFFGFLNDPNNVSSAIYNATQEEMSLLAYISELCSLRGIYAKPVVCKCREVMSVARSDFFVTDPFRTVILNYDLPKEKIILQENLQS